MPTLQTSGFATGVSVNKKGEIKLVFELTGDVPLDEVKALVRSAEEIHLAIG